MKFYSVLIILIISACNKSSSTNTPISDWKVRFEVDGRNTANQGYISVSNGTETYYTGTTSNNASWPSLPWTKDTVFSAKDGGRTVGLNVIKVINSPGPVLYNGDSVISRIYVNGTRVKEGKGTNLFLTASFH